MLEVMAEKGMKYTDQFIGDSQLEQRKRMNDTSNSSGNMRTSSASGPLRADWLNSQVPSPSFLGAVVGQNKRNAWSRSMPPASRQFLLFTRSGSAGAAAMKAESGTLDRVLSSRVTMTRFWRANLLQHAAAFTQLVVMFLWPGRSSARSLHAYSAL